MSPTLLSTDLEPIVAELSAANREFLARYPGESARRQPVHVVYGGAHFFSRHSAAKLGAGALRTPRENGPDAGTLAQSLGTAWTPELAATVHGRVVGKLEREAGEGFRLGFAE